MEDSEIIGLYHSRSEEALSQTAQKYGGYCRSIAWNILGDVLDVEETLNDTWLAAWNSIPPQKPRRLNVYLGRITRNLALNRLKPRTPKSAAEDRPRQYWRSCESASAMTRGTIKSARWSFGMP